MEFPKNIQIKLDDISFELRPYLTFEETLRIAKVCIETYDEGATNTENEKIYDDIKGYDKNVFLMEQIFNACLINLCTDIIEYDYDILVALGVIDYIKVTIVNAEATLNKINEIIKKRETLEAVVEKGISKLIEKLPTSKELKNLYSVVKKDMSSGKFNELLEKTKDIFDINKKG